jgi:sec-independent protein translocase protein TatA
LAASYEIVTDRTGRERVRPFTAEDALAPGPVVLIGVRYWLVGPHRAGACGRSRRAIGSRYAIRADSEWPPRRFLGTSNSLRHGGTPPTVSDMTGLTQPWHIILILLIALMLFGGRRLPEVGRSLGTGMREFKDSITGHDPPEPSKDLNPAETIASASQPAEKSETP